MSAGSLLIQLLSGLTSAGIIFLVSVGITLIFGAMRLINAAHGSFFMYGAFFLATSLGYFGGSNLGFGLGLIASSVLVGFAGAMVEMLILRRLYHREHLSQMIVTFAIFYIMADLARQLWGQVFRTVQTPPALDGLVQIGSGVFPVYSLFVMGVAVASGLLLFAIMRLTLFGWRIRAAVEDPELLAATGTNVRLLSTALFTLGTMLAALGGAVVAPLQALTSGMDAAILITAFIGSIVGGLGSAAGAALGAVILGVFQAFGVLWLPQWASIVPYVVMILLLAFRPNGLVGRAE